MVHERKPAVLGWWEQDLCPFLGRFTISFSLQKSTQGMDPRDEDRRHGPRNSNVFPHDIGARGESALMKYDVIITNGTLVGEDGETKADVAIHGETIAAVGPGLASAANAGAEIIDATGRLIIPGGVDVHVHLELPFCGTVSSDDWNTGTRAAARGGVTTVIDFAIPYGQETLIDAFNNWMARAKSKACVDYCFHIAITNWDRHGSEIEKLVRMGCPTFKEFMIYASEGWQADDRTIYNTLERCRELGAMLLVHAESSRGSSLGRQSAGLAGELSIASQRNSFTRLHSSTVDGAEARGVPGALSGLARTCNQDRQ